MLPAQRRDWLLDRLRTDGRLVAKDLAVELGVSEDSVRRDLRELAAAGLCQRVYGGALPMSPAVADYATRQDVETDSKRRVAAAAAALVVPGSTVILDGGTTALAVAEALPRDLRRHGRHPQPDDRGGARRPPERRGLPARRPPVPALDGHLRRRGRRGGAGRDGRRVPARRHRRSPRGRPDDGRRRRGGDEAGALAARRRDLRPGKRGEDRGRVAASPCCRSRP